MSMNDIRGSRPFPTDKDRQERCKSVLDSYGITQSEVATRLGVCKQLVSNVITGKQLSPSTETRIAGLFGLPREAMFPPRTAAEIAHMREAERREKARVARLRAERAKAAGGAA